MVPSINTKANILIYFLLVVPPCENATWYAEGLKSLSVAKMINECNGSIKLYGLDHFPFTRTVVFRIISLIQR